MYPMVSQINHNCLNNASYWTEDSKMIISTHVRVKKDEEISLGYIRDNFIGKEDRRKELSFRGFLCQCDRCVNEDPFSESDYETYKNLNDSLNGC